MFRYLISGGDVGSYLISMLLALPVILLSLSLHESAHAFAADKLGDPTARNLGRITLNPLKHLDPIGFLCMLLCGFGWANPVPINSRNLKNPRRDMALAALAGPVSNLLLSVVFLLLLRFVGYGWLATLVYHSETAYNAAHFLMLFFYYGISLNLTLAVFNLLPVPPLDGSRLLYLLLPPKYAYKLVKYERYIALAVMLLLFLGPLSWLINWVTGKIMYGMFALVGMKGFLI